MATFRRYLDDNATGPEDEERLAAKIMGRWRSGAPLALAPMRRPGLGADPRRNNAFLYEHETGGVHHARRLHIRRSTRATRRSPASPAAPDDPARHGYGPSLPDGVLEDDGADAA